MLSFFIYLQYECNPIRYKTSLKDWLQNRCLSQLRTTLLDSLKMLSLHGSGPLVRAHVCLKVTMPFQLSKADLVLHYH